MILSLEQTGLGKQWRFKSDCCLLRQSVWDCSFICRSILIRVYAVCHSISNFWTHYAKVKPNCSEFRIIMAIFGVSDFPLNFYGTYLHVLHISYWYPASLNSGRHRAIDSRTVGGSVHLLKSVCSYIRMIREMSLSSSPDAVLLLISPVMDRRRSVWVVRA